MKRSRSDYQLLPKILKKTKLSSDIEYPSIEGIHTINNNEIDLKDTFSSNSQYSKENRDFSIDKAHIEPTKNIILENENIPSLINQSNTNELANTQKTGIENSNKKKFTPSKFFRNINSDTLKLEMDDRTLFPVVGKGADKVICPTNVSKRMKLRLHQSIDKSLESSTQDSNRVPIQNDVQIQSTTNVSKATNSLSNSMLKNSNNSSTNTTMNNTSSASIDLNNSNSQPRKRIVPTKSYSVLHPTAETQELPNISSTPTPNSSSTQKGASQAISSYPTSQSTSLIQNKTQYVKPQFKMTNYSPTIDKKNKKLINSNSVINNLPQESTTFNRKIDIRSLSKNQSTGNRMLPLPQSSLQNTKKKTNFPFSKYKNENDILDDIDYKKSPKYTQLSTEQKKVLDVVMNSNDSVFFTGAAGSGKSHLLRVMIEFLRQKYGRDSVFVTASTGIAGCNIGGTTIHSFAGIGLGKGSKETLLNHLKTRESALLRWGIARVLIIDEISMLEAELLDKIDYIARTIRERKNSFFGGIQVILVGDFFQLPPVSIGEPKFCFEAECWKDVHHHFILKQVFRQKNPEFISILNQMREGNLSERGEALLRQCISKEFDNTDGIEPTELFPLKRDVEKLNLQRLETIPENSKIYHARDRGSKTLMEFLDKNCQAPSKLILKKHAQIVLLKNLDFDRNLVNGSRGVVADFNQYTGFPLIRFEGIPTPIEITEHEFEVVMGRERAIREQLPLNLAFSMSIHKAQGMTLNRVSTSLKEVFAPGQAYVSVSRVTSLEGLRLTSFDRHRIFAHQKVKEFYKQLEEKCKNF